MTVLVTGARGFVGANIVRRFAEDGELVIAVDRMNVENAVVVYWKAFRERIVSVRADLRDADWDRALPNEAIDVVVHAAAITNQGEPEEIARAADAVAVNIGGTINVLEWARRVRPKRIVHCSSGAVYGRLVEGDGLLDEDAQVKPLNVYAVTKFAGERLALRYRDLGGLDLIAARLPSQYGPMERDTGDRSQLSVVHGWCAAAVRGDELVVNRTLLPRDYTHVCDVADAVRTLAFAPALNHTLYNISTGVSVGYADVIAVLRDLFPELKVRYDDTPIVNPNDRRPLSPRRLLADTGWKAGFDLRRGLESYIRYLHRGPAAVDEERRPGRER